MDHPKGASETGVARLGFDRRVLLGLLRGMGGPPILALRVAISRAPAGARSGDYTNCLGAVNPAWFDADTQDCCVHCQYDTRFGPWG